MTDFAPDQTLDFKFSLLSTNHTPGQIDSGAAVVYKDNELTPLTAGVTFSADFNSITGLNNVRIVATEANGYTAGSSYQVVMSAGTIASNSIVGTVVAEFSILRGPEQVNQSIETVTTGGAISVGTQTSGTPDSTKVQDGIEWQITSVATGIDAELTFNLGSVGSENPGAFRMWGRFASGKNRVLQMQAWNYTFGVWENRGDVLLDSNSNSDWLITLGAQFVRSGSGPGVDGDVRIRFLYSSAVSSKVQAGDNLYIDKAAVFYTRQSINVGELVDALINAHPNRNYPESAIVIDTENGQPGSGFGTNGTPGNPVDNLTDARALADRAGFARYIVRSNSLLTLDAAHPDWEFRISPAAIVDFNGQDVDNSTFVGGVLRGVAVAAATGIRAAAAVLDGLTAYGTFNDCRLPRVDSLIANGGNISLIGCESQLPGTTNPSVDCNNIAALNLSIVKYGGGVDLKNVANDANVTVGLQGSVTLLDAATTATVIVSGAARLLGTLPTGVNLIDTARFDQPQITEAAWKDNQPVNGAAMGRAVDGIVMGTVASGSSATSINTSSLVPAAVDTDQFQGRVVTFDKDTATTALRGQSTTIQNSTTGGQLTVIALSRSPVDGDTFTIQ